MLVLLLALLGVDGSEGHACYGNGTCNAGLACRDGVCHAPHAGVDGSPCYGNGTCNAGLTCVESTCRADSPAEPGALGGACYGNGTCNTGLSCAAGVCAAKTAQQPSGPRVLVLPLEAVDVKKTDADLIDGSIGSALQKIPNLQVMSRADVQAMATLEAQKQLMGCDTEACLTELAGALDAQYVIYGQLGKLGEMFLVQLNLFDSKATKAIGREEVRSGSIESLPSRMQSAAVRLVAPLHPAVKPATDPELRPKFRALRAKQDVFSFAPLGLGVATCGALLCTASAASYAYTATNGVFGLLPPGLLVHELYTVIVTAPAALIGAAIWGGALAFRPDLSREAAELARELKRHDPSVLTSLNEADAQRASADWQVAVGGGLIAGGTIYALLSALSIVAASASAERSVAPAIAQEVAALGVIGGGAALLVFGMSASDQAAAIDKDITHRLGTGDDDE